MRSKKHLERMENPLGKKKVYACDKCEYRTTDKSNYNKHTKVHEEMRRVHYVKKCTLCDVRFSKEDTKTITTSKKEYGSVFFRHLHGKDHEDRLWKEKDIMFPRGTDRKIPIIDIDEYEMVEREEYKARKGKRLIGLSEEYLDGLNREYGDNKPRSEKEFLSIIDDLMKAVEAKGKDVEAFEDQAIQGLEQSDYYETISDLLQLLGHNPFKYLVPSNR